VTGKAAGDGHHHVAYGAALRLCERANPACDPFQALPVWMIERAQGFLEGRSLDHDGLARQQLSKPFRVFPERRFTAAAHRLDDFRGYDEGLRRHRRAAPVEDLLQAARL
jgi:hypothetical protein